MQQERGEHSKMISEKERNRILSVISRNYPDRMAVLFFPSKYGRSYLEKEKFIVHKDLTYVQFLVEVRRYCLPYKSLYITSEKKKTAPMMSAKMEEIAKEHGYDKDILCLMYSEESVFG